ncbi:MAG: hypothetical protein VKP62_02000 [Candidatus Sericytochromatia bacterium]|nr:hypothetical protein [Candidatus Sericytochromatia bacterium]
MLRPIAWSLSLVLLLGGCAVPGLTGPSKLPVRDPVTGKLISNAPLEPLAGVAFRPLTVANARYLSGQAGPVGVDAATLRAGGPVPAGLVGMDAATLGGGASAPAAPMAPLPASAERMVGRGNDKVANAGNSASTAGGAFSGNVWGGYGYRYYFGFGAGAEQMALVSVQEGETKGAQGGFSAIVSAVVGPVIKDWASDARLTEAGSTLTNAGALHRDDQTAPEAGLVPVRLSPFEGGAGWRLVYLSSARSEMLQFIVTPEKTTLVRLRWAPLELAPERVKVDAGEAIARVIKAVSDRSFAGEEERTRQDYFLGHAFEQPKTGEYDGDEQKTEVLYQVPGNARWSVSLQQIVGKLVWELNWHAPEGPGADNRLPIAVPGVAVAVSESMTPAKAAFRLLQGTSVSMPAPDRGLSPVPMPPDQVCNPVQRKETNRYTNQSGSAMVDAESGAVIRFTRPTRVTHTWFNSVCEVHEPKPVPTPTSTATPPQKPVLPPSPAPTPVALPSPDPSATSTAEAAGRASGTLAANG